MTKPPLFKNVEDYFSKSDVYSKVVKNNYMFHLELFALLKSHIDKCLKNTPFSILDLGSGDAFFMSQILENTKVSAYTAFDLSKDSLERAKENLKNVHCEKSFLMQDFSKDFSIYNPNKKFDIVWSSFALHHLSHEQKKRFFEQCFELLADKGSFILVDIYNDVGSKLDWFKLYKLGVEKDWNELTPEDKEYVCDHVYNFDFPESYSILLEISKQAGFTFSRELLKKDLYCCIEYKR